MQIGAPTPKLEGIDRIRILETKIINQDLIKLDSGEIVAKQICKRNKSLNS